jgi:lipopolysaccharide biosynthesis glycosyltransferase
LGWDSREATAFHVATRTLHKHASTPALITGLNIENLAANGLLRRPTDTRGQRYDILSNAPASTEFAISRFTVPFLAQTGWALFADCDVVFMGDVAELFYLADPKYAVMCVKHNFDNLSGSKMDSQSQVPYPRKLWSSVMLWNCDHPANKRLSLVDVNERPGRDLHALYWLHDSEIGDLPREWNWLVGLQEKPENPKIAHFTLGTPDLGVKEIPEHKIWWDAYAA